ncbi:MAG: class I SAM-dependent methyltransferase [Vicinamibacterales bacterium]
MHSTRVITLLPAALDRRRPLLESAAVTAYRLIDGAGDRLAGVYLDRYGPAAVLGVYDDAALDEQAVTEVADAALAVLAPHGVESVYVKRFARDRSRLGGQAPEESRQAQPRAGVPQPETIVVHEYGSQFEVRLYDGFSTGLFLDHREHRHALASPPPARVLNLFAYTCAFAVPLVAAGAHVSNVDVSARYLAWGRRNLELNGLPFDRARFSRMDAFAFLAWASKRAERFDLIILDPPTFAAGDAREKRKPWKAVTDYPALVQAASQVLAPGGRIFAASNTRELASVETLQRVIEQGLGRLPAWQALPPWPPDVTEDGRVAAVLFSL